MKKYALYLICLMWITLNTSAQQNNTPITTNDRIETIELILQQDNLGKEMRRLYQKQLYQLQITQSVQGPIGGTASISGTVIDGFGDPIPDHFMSLVEIVGTSQINRFGVQTDASGHYSFENLAASTYAIGAGFSLDDYLDYVWRSAADGGPLLCSGCMFPIESHIDLADAQVINGIDFSAELGGVISGNLSDASTSDPVSTLSLQLSNIDLSTNYFVNGTIDEITGDYTIKGIPDGDYRLYLQQSYVDFNDHIPQVYGGPECNDCSRLVFDGIGSLINITSANTVNNVDFLLNTGASISGRVVDSISLNPLQELAFIMIFDQLNYNLTAFIINGTNIDPTATGNFTIGGLLPGSYYVQGGDLGREFYQRELYANKPCYWSGCDRGADGDPVVLSAGENRVGVNFLLEVGGKISGTVTDAMTGLPLSLASGENIWMAFYNDQERVIGGAFVNFDGTYISARGLPPGNYAVRTGSMFTGELTSPYVNEKYNDIDCAALACDLSTQDVNVVANVETTNIDFALNTGFSFSGTITDTATALPIPDVNVLVYKDMGPSEQPRFANWATTSDGTDSPEGSFEVSGLPAGTYYAVTNNGSNLPFNGLRPSPGAGWVDILYNGMPCPAAGCNIASGTPIILPTPAPTTEGTTGSTNIDITLRQGASIEGTVLNFNDSASIPDISVNVFDDQGQLYGSFVTDESGVYKTAGFPAGTYYLTTSSFEVMVDVKFGNDVCFADSCNPLDGTPVVLSEEQVMTGIDFILRPNALFGNAFE